MVVEKRGGRSVKCGAFHNAISQTIDFALDKKYIQNSRLYSLTYR